MTLLSICTDAADEIGITQPSSVVGNTAPDSQKLLRYANKVGRRLMKTVPWQIARKEQTFTALGQSEQTSILPSDFDRFIPETFWDRTNLFLVSGPITSVEWQGFVAGSYSDTSNRKFIYRGGSVFILPAPAGGETLAFEYVSKNWCQSSGAVAQTAWAADTDTGILDEELMTYALIYEYLLSEGLPFEAAAGQYKRYFDILIDSDQPTAGVMVSADIFGGGRHFTGVPSVNTGITVL
jgi:hypothetical protein